MMKFGILPKLKNSCKCPYCKNSMPFYKWTGSRKKVECAWCGKFFKLPLKKENNV